MDNDGAKWRLLREIACEYDERVAAVKVSEATLKAALQRLKEMPTLYEASKHLGIPYSVARYEIRRKGK